MSRTPDQTEYARVVGVDSLQLTDEEWKVLGKTTVIIIKSGVFFHGSPGFVAYPFILSQILSNERDIDVRSVDYNQLNLKYGDSLEVAVDKLKQWWQGEARFKENIVFVGMSDFGIAIDIIKILLNSQLDHLSTTILLYTEKSVNPNTMSYLASHQVYMDRVWLDELRSLADNNNIRLVEKTIHQDGGIMGDTALNASQQASILLRDVAGAVNID